ncbi:MAG: hypothetical protein IPJ81_07865 [Chitinophagaceae bacterium]|nr:hypothetical protein [Chitinophagaceae bacterium]
MKKLVSKTMQLSAVVMIFMVQSCNKTPLPYTENVITENTNNDAKLVLVAFGQFNTNVGSTVDGNTGQSWINKYKAANGGVGKTYTLNNAGLRAILNKPNCVGICLYPAKDNSYKDHVLPIGVDKYGKVIPMPTVNTMSGNITWKTAYAWIVKAQGLNKGRFLGKNTFVRLKIFSCYTCKITQVDYGINEQNVQQYLLSNPYGLNAARQFEDRSVTPPASSFPAP